MCSSDLRDQYSQKRPTYCVFQKRPTRNICRMGRELCVPKCQKRPIWSKETNILCCSKETYVEHAPADNRVLRTEMSKETYIDMSKETHIVKRDLYRSAKTDLYSPKRPLYCRTRAGWGESFAYRGSFV